MTAATPRRRRRALVYFLLALPFIGLIWPGLYARETPVLWGIPFFYWYQMAWVPLSVIATGIAYRLDRPNGK